MPKTTASTTEKGPAGPIELLIADVDGTLLTPEGELTKRARAAALALGPAGIRFAVTSSRPPRGMRPLIDPLSLTTPLSGFNGGMLVDERFSVLEKHAIDPLVARQVLTLFDEYPVDVWVYRGMDWYVSVRHGPHVDHEVELLGFEPIVRSDLSGELDEAMKIVAVSDDRPLMARLEDATNGLDAPISASQSQPHYVDVTHSAANKGHVVRFLSEHLGISPERIAVIGDGPNDVSMFEACETSVAMGNAEEDVRRRARYVTASNSDEGFARAVHEWILPRAPRGRESDAGTRPGDGGGGSESGIGHESASPETISPQRG